MQIGLGLVLTLISTLCSSPFVPGIFLIGGSGDIEPSSAAGSPVYILDVLSGQWSQAAPLPISSIQNHTATRARTEDYERIYVFGGVL